MVGPGLDLGGFEYPVASTPGDLTGDGAVDAADLQVRLENWGACDGCAADLNNDGVVGGADLALLISYWS